MSRNDGLVRRLKESGVLKSPHIIKAFEEVDRAAFVTEGFNQEAYADRALPLGEGQTISQPTTVATMIEALGPEAGMRVLDVGAGSGWTTALLAHIVGASQYVHATEIVRDLVRMGNANLRKYSHLKAAIHQAHELGHTGHMPYDRILVSAVTPSIPQELVDQLHEKGRIVLPVGEIDRCELIVYDHAEKTTKILPGQYSFVPLRKRS